VDHRSAAIIKKRELSPTHLVQLYLSRQSVLLPAAAVSGPDAVHCRLTAVVKATNMNDPYTCVIRPHCSFCKRTWCCGLWGRSLGPIAAAVKISNE